MLTKPLGATVREIAAIGLGTWNYTGGAAPIRRAIALGATHIDTAEMYHTEEAVGQAIKPLRDRVFLSTKVSAEHLAYDDVIRAADQSLTALGVDHVDLYQVHWPNPRMAIEETMRAMATLVDAGKVRFIGVSNFDRTLLARARIALGRHPIVSNQVPYNLIDRRIEADLVPYCESEHITIIAYSPLATGLDHITAHDRAGALAHVASELGRTPAQVALAWCLARPSVVVIPKANSVERVEENCAAAEIQLTAEHLALLSGIEFNRESRFQELRRRASGFVRGKRAP